MWINKIPVRSATSDREYTVSELAVDGIPTGTWGCSCPWWKRTGNCKHLAAMGLPSSRERDRPPTRKTGTKDSNAFRDEAYNHYDPSSSGYGSAGEWRRMAEALKGGNVYIAPTDEQWDEISRLVDERELNKMNMMRLDSWLMEGGNRVANTPTAIIMWLKGFPVKK